MASDDEALEWARRRLTEIELWVEPGAEVEVEPVKVRPWASTWRLSAARQVAFLKACAPETAYEAQLMAALSAADPDRMAPVLAVEGAAGWLLLGDAGELLRDRLGDTLQPAQFAALLARFGELQRAVAPLTAELVAAGVPDERPERLGGVLETLLRDSPNLAGLTGDERAALLDRAGWWERAAAELAALGVPASVQHGDLHDGNVAIGTDGRARFFDFGDASVAHPFSTLLVPLRIAAHRGAEPAELDRLRDAYLEVFTDLAPAGALRRGLDLALTAAPLLRATSWNRALLGLSDTAPAAPEWAEGARDWLHELLAVLPTPHIPSRSGTSANESST